MVEKGRISIAHSAIADRRIHQRVPALLRRRCRARGDPVNALLRDRFQSNSTYETLLTLAAEMGRKIDPRDRLNAMPGVPSRRNARPEAVRRKAKRHPEGM
jgi:hypothetical protein